MKTEIVEGKICVSDVIPTNKDSPPILGYIWIYFKDPTIYICLDNTNNQSVWKHIDQTRIDALYTKYNEYINKINKYQKDLDKYLKYVEQLLKG